MTAVKKPKPESTYEVIRWNVPTIEISIPNIWRVKAWVETLEAPIPAEELARLESAFQSRVDWARVQRKDRVRYSQALLSTLECGLALIHDQKASVTALAA